MARRITIIGIAQRLFDWPILINQAHMSNFPQAEKLCLFKNVLLPVAGFSHICCSIIICLNLKGNKKKCENFYKFLLTLEKLNRLQPFLNINWNSKTLFYVELKFWNSAAAATAAVNACVCKQYLAFARAFFYYCCC